MSLYEDLGVPPDATDAEIKRAYRKRAQRVHPDKPGGSNEEFQGLKHAYETLSDRSRRDRYDQTGSSDSIDINLAAQNRVISLLFSAIDAIELDELERVNLIDVLRKRIINDRETDQKAIATIHSRIAKRERILKRIRRKMKDGKTNILVRALQKDIDERRRRIEIGKEALAGHEAALKFLDEYCYDADLVLPHMTQFASIIARRGPLT